MTIRNLDWYDLNETRCWPLDDTATCIDDIGARLASNLIADLNIWFPVTIGERAFVSAVTVSDRIATVVISSTAAGYPAIAAVSIVDELEAYRNYQLEALYPGVSGWIVFGNKTLDSVPAVHRFSTPEQSILVPQVARAYEPLPIPYVGKYGVDTRLTGLVKLLGGGDLAIVKEHRIIGVEERDVIVFKLIADTTEQAAAVLAKYLGICDVRPESGNCAGVEPIEIINSVQPDCCGCITLEFRGAIVPRPVSGDSSCVILDVDFGLAQACSGLKRLPDEEGRLPNEAEDSCEGLYFPAPEVQ